MAVCNDAGCIVLLEKGTTLEQMRVLLASNVVESEVWSCKTSGFLCAFQTRSLRDAVLGLE